jgi:effector-binding domain-containing protein
MKKKYLIGLLIFIFPFLTWYLFFKKGDFTISFKSKATAGVIYQGVNEWVKQQQKLDFEVVSLTKNKFDFIEVRLKKGNEDKRYFWNINYLNDSITSVSVHVKDQNNSVYNRLILPFFATKFNTSEIAKIKEFKKNLDEHLATFKVKINGKGTSESAFVAYLQFETIVPEKAQSMMMNDGVITGYLSRNSIKIIGKPYTEIVKWNVDTEKITFNYCFPIDSKTKYIPDTKVKFKVLPKLTGLQATYYGNMRTSDRAWFALLDYANKNKLKLNYLPREQYFANPFNGGDELEWETRIIIPFDDK